MNTAQHQAPFVPLLDLKAAYLQSPSLCKRLTQQLPTADQKELLETEFLLVSGG